MIKELTPEQEAQIPNFISKWVDMASKKTDREAATKAIKAMYKRIGEEEPAVVFGQSPFSTSAMAAMFFELVKSSDFKKDQLQDPLWGQLRGQLQDQLEGQLDGQLQGQLWDQLRSPLRGTNNDWRINIWWLAWAGWYDYARFIGVKFDKETYELFMSYVKNIGFVIPYKGIVFISEAPTKIVWEDGILHYDQGKAVEYADGYGLYSLKGVTFEEELYWKIVEEAITAEEVIKIQPIEKRMAAIAMLKPDEMMKQMNGKLIDTGKKETKLYQVDNYMDTGDTEYAMVMECPSTGRIYVEWSPPEIGKQGSADLCQAAALNLPLEDYLTMQEA